MSCFLFNILVDRFNSPVHGDAAPTGVLLLHFVQCGFYEHVLRL
jgi:hypothetical protein